MEGGEVVEDLALHVHVDAQEPVQELREARVGLLRRTMPIVNQPDFTEMHNSIALHIYIWKMVFQAALSPR